MTGLRCTPSASMRSRRRKRRLSSWASWRIRSSSGTRRRSFSEEIKGLERVPSGRWAGLLHVPAHSAGLDVSAAAAPEEVQDEIAAEEEEGDYDEEPYDAQ